MRILLNEKPLEIASGMTLRELCAQFKPDADVVIRNGFPESDDPLLAADDAIVLIRRGEAPTLEEFEALLCARHTPGVHERVRRATVGIAGCGGLGSAVAIALARTGVGRLILADFDLVEPSNLNRQQFFFDQIGLAKVDALRENLRRINPGLRVAIFHGRIDRENLVPVFSPADLLIEAFDAPEAKAMLVETWRKQVPKKPLVAASGLAGYGPAATLRTRRAGNNLWIVGDGESAAGPGAGLMAPRVGIAAHMQANAALRLLLGLEPE